MYGLYRPLALSNPHRGQDIDVGYEDEMEHLYQTGFTKLYSHYWFMSLYPASKHQPWHLITCISTTSLQ